MIRAISTALLAVAAGVQPAASDVAIEQILLDGSQVGATWEVVNEEPTDASADPDLAEWGVREVRSRHYTRSENGVAQVCSLEIWNFESVAQARVAHRNLSYPQWQITREGSLLFLVRALTRSRGVPPQRAVFAACEQLAERTRRRATAIMRSD